MTSWLNEQTHVCVYTCPDGHENHWEGDWDTKPANMDCLSPECGKQAEYAGFEPVRLGGMTIVAYEQNGRLAYRTTHPNGKITYVSKTRRDYMRTSVIKNQYTKGYQGHVDQMSANERGVRALVSSAEHKDKDID